MIKKIIKRIIDYSIKQYFFQKGLQERIIYKWNSEQIKKSYQIFEKDLSTSVIFDNKEQIRSYCIKKSLEIIDKTSNKNNFFLEFGVYKGESLKFFSKILEIYNKKIYGFDSFEGLSHDWVGNLNHPTDTFAIKEFPLPLKDKNYEVIIGDIFKTLPGFINKNLKLSHIHFIHIDVDIYEVAIFILKNLKKYLIPGSVILFDEMHSYPGFEKGEFKALQEVFLENEYKFLAFSEPNQAAIIIV
jgi:hypothetical protein